MRENKYLLICCGALILLALSIRTLKLKESEQALMRGSVAQIKPVDIDKNILLSEKVETKPVVVPKPVAPVIPKPYISAEAYLIGNLETGEIYVHLNENKVVPIASVSKLYTALVVEHLFDPEKIITVTQQMLDAGYGDAGHLTAGEKFTSEELLYPLLLESSNDVAEAYAQSFGYEEFMKQMNGFAQEIGMNSTSFRDASGISPNNVSNAQDLFTLAQYLHKKEKDILAISDTKEIEFATTTDHGFHHLVNINPYVFYPSFIGGKTGRTEEAKESMVSLFNQKIGMKEYPIAVIVLRSEFNEREIDTEKLLGMYIDKVNKQPN